LFHDSHTSIASSIAEILYPQSEVCPQVPTTERELYLRHAREACRRFTVSPLRNFIGIVERDITNNTFENIKYDRIPSLAMDRYQKLFAKKDARRFDQYVENLASGKSRISGSILLPANIVAKAYSTLQGAYDIASTPANGPKRGNDALVAAKLADMQAKVADGQWRSLVQRIKDSGTMQSSIAVCDVSGSMTYPQFPDGTCPMHSALGLSLLLAEVVEPPFGGSFITFSERPQVQKINLDDSLAEKLKTMSTSNWGMNTDFEAVFLKLILPLALKHKLKQEDMVKRVFCFSDMEFDVAANGEWSSSFERIKTAFEKKGYEVPELIFWNLAANGDRHTKAVTADEPGTALVSGYSQGQMKMFLDNGQFEDPEKEEEVEEEEIEEKKDSVDGAEEDGIVEVKKKKAKMTPLDFVRKAISHKAYEMLKVVD
jgi:hypothetical protein